MIADGVSIVLEKDTPPYSHLRMLLSESALSLSKCSPGLALVRMAQMTDIIPGNPASHMPTKTTNSTPARHGRSQALSSPSPT